MAQARLLAPDGLAAYAGTTLLADVLRRGRQEALAGPAFRLVINGRIHAVTLPPRDSDAGRGDAERTGGGGGEGAGLVGDREGLAALAALREEQLARAALRDEAAQIREELAPMVRVLWPAPMGPPCLPWLCTAAAHSCPPPSLPGPSCLFPAQETLRAQCQVQARAAAKRLAWGALAAMGLQLGFLARLTWWDFSWDIMEPVTYFVTYGTQMAMCGYFVITQREYDFETLHGRKELKAFYRVSGRWRL